MSRSIDTLRRLFDEVRILKNADTSRRLYASIQNYPNWDSLRTVGIDSTTITTLLEDYAKFKKFKIGRVLGGDLFEVHEYFDINFGKTIQVVFAQNTIGFFI